MPNMSAITCCDRTRRNIISTQHLTKVFDVNTRWRWRNSDRVSHLDLHKIEIAQPDIVYWYYRYAGIVNLHNYRRQHVLNLEKKFQVKNWDTRVKTSILGVISVNAYLLYDDTRHESSNDVKV